MNLPFVTIVVPAYNAEKTIETCIKSLIAQNYPDEKYEIIITDNNSTDNTANLIKKYPVTYLSEKNIQTAGSARNKAIQYARGKIIAFTDSDCVADSNWLINGINCFKNDNIGAVGGKIEAYNPATWIEYHLIRSNILNQESTLTPDRIKNKTAVIATGNAFFLKKIFKEIGMFKDNLKGGEDFELCLRLQQKTNYSLLYAPCALIYHKHATSLKKLITQFVRYGKGDINNEFDKKYLQKFADEIKKQGIIKILYWKISSYKILKNLFNTAKYFFLYIFSFKNDYKTDFIDAFLFTVRKTAFLYGELLFYYSARKNL